MNHVALIEQYGYVATFVGTLLEGETLLILSGLAAHRGYLSFPLVVLVGAVGGALGDMGFFLLGRYYGARLIERFPRFAPAVGKVHGMVERHPAVTIVAVRFMYGLRAAGPAIIGTTRLSWTVFVPLNILGALVWSACWAGAGWVLGKAAEQLLGNIAHIEKELFVVALVAAVVGAVGYRVWSARKRAGAGDAGVGDTPVKR